MERRTDSRTPVAYNPPVPAARRREVRVRELSEELVDMKVYLVTAVLGLDAQQDEELVKSHFERVAEHFVSERSIQFATVDVRRRTEWRALAAAEEEATGVSTPIIVWHPKRHKYLSLGFTTQGGERGSSALKIQLEAVLDGNKTNWTKTAMPPRA